MAILPSVSSTIGRTPLVQLNRLAAGLPGRVLVKMESHNPLGSVKDRIGLAMIEDAEQRGALRPGGTIIEPTSGNTGIALAFVAAAKGYRLVLCMPESMSMERRHILRVLGAELILTPTEKGMPGAVARAESLLAETPGAFMPMQFRNPANPRVHYQTTGPEIWGDTAGAIDAFVAGVGTGGTITGVARFLKERNPSVRAIAVEPRNSPVISGGKPGPHRIQGIGAGFVPENLDRSVIDEVILLSEEDAAHTAREAARLEGLLMGISAGGNLWAALQLAARPEMKDKTVVTVLCDTGERYLSTWLFQA